MAAKILYQENDDKPEVLLDLSDAACASLDSRLVGIKEMTLVATEDGRAIFPQRYAHRKFMLRAAMVDLHIEPALRIFPPQELEAAHAGQAAAAKIRTDAIMAAVGIPEEKPAAESSGPVEAKP